MLKSLGKLALATPLVLTACVQDAGLPDLGPCSTPPDQDLFEFGQIDVGTCIASPSDLQIHPDPQSPDNHFLYVVNSNAYSNFTGSSLLTIDASSIDLSCPVNGMHEVAAFGTGMQEFAGRLAVDESRNLGLLSARVNGQLDGDLTDVVFTLDVSDPRNIGFSDLGPRAWGPFRYIQVPADPWSVQVNPANGRAYVLGLTTHSVSAIDLISDPIQFLDLRGDLTVSSADFTDVDGSGSAPDFSFQSVLTAEVQDEVLTLTFQEGTTRLFYATAEGTLQAANAGDGVTFVDQAGGAVVTPDEAIPWSAGGLVDAAVGFEGEGLSALLTGRDASGKRSIGRMTASDHALDWTVASTAAIAPSENGVVWDTTGVFDPDWLIDADGTIQAYFSGGPGWGTAIGHASGTGLSTLTRGGDEALVDGASGQVLAAGEAGEWDSAAVFAPAVIGNAGSDLLHLYYSGHDGTAVGELPGLPAIGLATSADGVTFTRAGVVLDVGDAGEWDAMGVGWPTVFFDNGRWQLWYRGYDGVSWRVGRATSIDGINWTKDARNPVSGDFLDASGDAPLRVFAQKVSPVSGYQITGEISGDLPFLASEGIAYETGSSPIGFLVVGGQALGRGPSGSYDRDGAAAAGRAGDTDWLVYAGWQGSRTRLALARDQGAGAERVSSLPGSGWTGTLEGLNGDDPSLSLHEPDVQGADVTDQIVAFTVGGAIAVGRIDVDGTDTPVSFSPLAAEPVLGQGGEDAFDSGGVSAPALLLEGHDDNVRLFYAGTRGESASIGLATAGAPGGPYTRSDVEAFARGGAGAWDDASITSPSAVWDADAGLYHLWYLGSDGAFWRLGHATSADAVTWTRNTDADGVTQPVFDGTGLPFVGDDGLHAARVRQLADGRFELWFEGRLDGIPRIGRAISSDGVSWSTITNPTTAGDTFTLETRKGDEDASTGIHLGEPPKQGEAAESVLLVDGFRIHGAGVSDMILSPDGQYGLVANKRTNIITVLDLRDDSTDDWTDANVNGVEAVFRIPQRYGIVGTRELVFSPDGTKLHAILGPLVFSESGDNELRTGTEGFITLDWTLVEDTADGTLLFEDAVLSYTPLARGREEDQGYRSDVSVGPSAFVLSADGSRAYVTNYNDNSLWILDLTAGARGAVIQRVQPLDEAPSEVALSPDGRLAYVANYIGWSRNIVTHSTIQVVDVDEASPTFGEVLTTLTNIDSRSDRGCE